MQRRAVTSQPLGNGDIWKCGIQRETREAHRARVQGPHISRSYLATQQFTSEHWRAHKNESRIHQRIYMNISITTIVIIAKTQDYTGINTAININA